MAQSFNSQANPGSFIPTTSTFEIQQLAEAPVTSPEFKELLVKLYETVNQIALVLNSKESGYYPLVEFVNGQLYFPNPLLTSSTTRVPTQRQVIRKVINFGALPNTATKSVAHGVDITNTYTFTNVTATSTDTLALTGLNIPYASATAANSIELNTDATNVNITTGINRTAFNQTYVLLEFITS